MHQPVAQMAPMDLCRQRQQLGNFVEAEKHFRQALQANPDLWQSHNFLGMVYDRQPHFDAAIAEYQAAIALQPALGLLFNNLGMSYYAKGEYEHAVMALRQALTHEPSHKKISNNLGMALGRLGRYPEAFEAFKKGGGRSSSAALIHVRRQRRLAKP